MSSYAGIMASVGVGVGGDGGSDHASDAHRAGAGLDLLASDALASETVLFLAAVDLAMLSMAGRAYQHAARAHLTTTRFANLYELHVDDRVRASSRRARQLAAGGAHSLMLLGRSGAQLRAFSCGASFQGQLGVGPTNTSTMEAGYHEPVAVRMGCEMAPVESVAAGPGISAFALADGRVALAGSAALVGKLPLVGLADAAADCVRTPTEVAIDADGGGWSGIVNGNVDGNGSAIPAGLLAKTHIVGVSVGRFHLLMWSMGGQLYSCGQGTCGRLGLGDHESRWAPTLVRDLPPGCVAAAAGFAHSVAICRGAGGATEVYSWGKNAQGQLGLGIGDDLGTALADKLTPERVTITLPRSEGHGQGWREGGEATETPAAPVVFQAVSCGYHHTLVLVSGRVFSFGETQNGRCGHGPDSHRTNAFFPTIVDAFPAEGGPVVSISCGYFHSLAVSVKGALYSFGAGKGGRLGNGCTDDEWLPYRVTVGAGAGGSGGDERIVACSGGDMHSLAIGESGRVYGMGYNGSGRLGVGDNVPRYEPALVNASAWV